MMPVTDAEHSSHAPNDTAHRGPDGASHDSADRTSRSVASGRALFGPAHNALGLRADRSRNGRNNQRGQNTTEFHGTILPSQARKVLGHNGESRSRLAGAILLNGLQSISFLTRDRPRGFLVS